MERQQPHAEGIWLPVTPAPVPPPHRHPGGSCVSSTLRRIQKIGSAFIRGMHSRRPLPKEEGRLSAGVGCSRRLLRPDPKMGRLQSPLRINALEKSISYPGAGPPCCVNRNGDFPDASKRENKGVVLFRLDNITIFDLMHVWRLGRVILP